MLAQGEWRGNPRRKSRLRLVYSHSLSMFYTYCAMTISEMPVASPYQRPFRIFGVAAILLLLGIFFTGVYEPFELSDVTRHALAGVAGAIVLAAVVVAIVLPRKESLWKFTQTHPVELSNGKIIQRRPGLESVEIPLDQMASLHEGHGWLIVKGSQPAQQIAIRRGINDFEIIKRELAAHQAIVPLKIKVCPLSLLYVGLTLATWLLLFTSHSRAVVIASGAAALLLQGSVMYSQRRVWRAKSMYMLSVLTYVLMCLAVAWIVYQRLSAAI